MFSGQGVAGPVPHIFLFPSCWARSRISSGGRSHEITVLNQNFWIWPILLVDVGIVLSPWTSLFESSLRVHFYVCAEIRLMKRDFVGKSCSASSKIQNSSTFKLVLLTIECVFFSRLLFLTIHYIHFFHTRIDTPDSSNAVHHFKKLCEFRCLHATTIPPKIRDVKGTVKSD